MTVQSLTHLGLLKFSGEDAGEFLQGQLTNDVNELKPSKNGAIWQLSGYCNPKGRLLALFYIWQDEENYFALVDKALLEPISDRLRMFVMRSKVTIEAAQDKSLVGVHANDVQSELSLDAAGLKSGQTLITNHSTLLQVNQRTLVIAKQTPEESGSYLSATDWLCADIADGIPQVTARTTEMFIPQMLNLDVIGGINFQKGCYTGQEIVARMHYLGNLKQRLFVCSITASASEQQAGDKIYNDSDLVKPVGTIVSIAKNHVLAVLRLDSIEQPLYLDSQLQLHVDQPQPYSIPDIN